MQVFFEALGGCQQAQDSLSFLVGYLGDALRTLEPLLQPGPLVGVGDVQVFDANAAAVHLFAERDDVAQLHSLRSNEGARVEFTVEVGFVEILERQVEVGDRRAVRVAERTQLGFFMTAHPVGADQLDDAGFLVVGQLRVGGGRQPAQLAELLLHVEVAGLRGRAVAQAGEDLSPGRRHAVLVEQPVFVPAFDPRCVGARKVR